MIANQEARDGRDAMWLQYVLFALLLIAATGMRLHEVGTVTLYSQDEASYARLTEIARSQGSSGLRAEAARFRADPSLYEHPAPVRAGYVYWLAAVMRVTGGRDPRAFEICSALTDGVSLFLLGLLAWNWLGPRRALVAMLLYGVSPPVIAMARRAWQEPTVVCLGLLVIWAALQSVERREAGWTAGLGVLAALSFTVKETAFVEACAVLALAGVTLAWERRWKDVLWLGGSFAGTLGVCWLGIGFVLGGVGEVAHFLSENARVSGASSYARQMQSGSMMDWLEMLWKGDPFLMTLGALGAGLTVVAWRGGGRPSRLLVWSMALAAIFLLLPALTANRLNLRFAAPAFGPLCWLGAEALFAIHRLLQASLPRGRTAVRVAMMLYLGVIGFAGVRQYQAKFAAHAMADLSAGLVLAPDAQEPRREGASR